MFQREVSVDMLEVSTLGSERLKAAVAAVAAAADRNALGRTSADSAKGWE
jgi:hypothetical protein